MTEERTTESDSPFVDEEQPAWNCTTDGCTAWNDRTSYVCPGCGATPLYPIDNPGPLTETKQAKGLKGVQMNNIFQAINSLKSEDGRSVGNVILRILIAVSIAMTLYVLVVYN